MAIGKEFFSLEEKISYKFSDIKLLETALTHSSFVNEKKARGMSFESNERLEFLGDAVLQIAVSKCLFENYKNRSEGVLTKMRQHLVCEKTLSKIAAEISLGDYLNLGRGEEIMGCRERPKVLADAMEAVFGAVYLDCAASGGDYEKIIVSLLVSEIENAASMQKGDCKTLLQQLVEQDGASVLEYVVSEESGPEHNKTFTVVAKVNNNIVGLGTSKSKKDAEMQAARVALRLFGVSI
jgi:ribonuclease-3